MEPETTTTHTAKRRTPTIDDIVDSTAASIRDQVLLTQGHFVDALLDIHATDDIGLRWSIADRLDEIRFLNALDAAEFRADLAAIAGIAASIASTETDGTRAALNECCSHRAA